MKDHAVIFGQSMKGFADAGTRDLECLRKLIRRWRPASREDRIDDDVVKRGIVQVHEALAVKALRTGSTGRAGAGSVARARHEHDDGRSTVQTDANSRQFDGKARGAGFELVPKNLTLQAPQLWVPRREAQTPTDKVHGPRVSAILVLQSLS